MNKKKEIIILDTDSTSAQLKTVTGWVSSNGRFYGNDERLARLDGCTHKKCECGNLMGKGYLLCNTCRGKKDMERYMAYPFEEWDGIIPVCIFNGDEYFFSEDEIEEYLEENGLRAEDLMLVLCKPHYFKEISSDYWEYDLPEDRNVPKELEEIIEETNVLIKTLKLACWIPSEIRTEYKL